MFFYKNPEVEYIPVDETSFVVHNSQNGSTCLLDEIGMQILDILENKTSFEDLLRQLSVKYETTEDYIFDDVKAFVDSALSSGMILKD